MNNCNEKKKEQLGMPFGTAYSDYRTKYRERTGRR